MNEFNFYTDYDTLCSSWIADNPMAMDNCYSQDTFHCFAEGKLTPTLRSIMPASCQFDFSAPLGPLGCNSEEILCLKLATVFHDHNMLCSLPEVSLPLTHPQAQQHWLCCI